MFPDDLGENQVTYYHKTHISKIVFPERGFDFPWKARKTPKVKNGLLALSMVGG